MQNASAGRIHDALRSAICLGALVALAVSVYSLFFLLLAVSVADLIGFIQANARVCVRRVALLVVSASTLLRAACSARRLAVHAAGTAGELQETVRGQARPFPPRLLPTLVNEGVAGHVVLYHDPIPRAFVAGLWRPRIYITTGLVEQLTPCEFIAVLRHERFHLRRRDPLRYLVARTAYRSVHFLPLAEESLRAFLLATELAADRSALASGNCMDLASALVKVARGRGSGRPATAAAGVTTALEIRLAHLLGTEKEVKDHGIRPSSVVSAAITLCLLACLILHICDWLPLPFGR